MVAADQLPVLVAADRLPVLVAADQLPVLVAADQLPVLVAADRSPVLVAADRSPVLVAADCSPVLDTLAASQSTLPFIHSTAFFTISGKLISVSIVIFADAIFVSSLSFDVPPLILTTANLLSAGL